MDKNMIHIDDLVRQRLNGEEQERPGAWLNMRDLLDQKMPVTSSNPGGHWRRIFGLGLGVAVLATLSIGGYQMANSFRDDAGAEVVKNNGSGLLVESKAERYPDQTETNLNTAGTRGISTNVETDRDAVSAKTQDKNSNVRITPPTQTAGVHTNTGNFSDGVTDRSAKRIQQAEAVAFEKPSDKKELNNTPSVKDQNQNLAIASERDAGSVDHPATKIVPRKDLSAIAAEKSKNAVQEQAPLASVADLKREGIDGIPGLRNNDIPSMKETKPVEADIPGIAHHTEEKPAPVNPMVPPKDTIEKLNVVQRYIVDPFTLSSRVVFDTVATNKIAVDNTYISKVIDSEVKNDASAMTKADAADESHTMMPLSSLKVKSTRTNKWNTRSFDEVMRDMKFNLSQTRFYTGVSAGGNSYMFGANSFSGFQIGLFGLFTFGENLSAMAELKYMHRFNGGATLKDNYFDIREISGQGFVQGEVEHFFKFSALQSIEMPLAIRYALGRLNVFAGMNIAYNFGINPEEVMNKPGQEEYFEVTTPNWTDTKPRISYRDFGSRVSLGGLAGISYELTPSVQLDLRATRNVWDNSFGIGAAQVSRELYRSPSFQFSLFYRFSQRNKIPKAR